MAAQIAANMDEPPRPWHGLVFDHLAPDGARAVLKVTVLVDAACQVTGMAFDAINDLPDMKREAALAAMKLAILPIRDEVPTAVLELAGLSPRGGA